MNQIIKQKWIDALRNNQFKHGKFALRQEINGDLYHCPLGVLCELYLKEFKAYWKLIEPNKTKYSLYNHDGSLPPPVQMWAELKDNPYIEGIGTIIDLNDVENYSFSQMANLIEKYL